MEKYLERYNLLRLNQEEIENMDKPITSTVTDFSNLKTPKTKSPGPDGFRDKFYQTFRE